jgi:hypothetical protein
MVFNCIRENTSSAIQTNDAKVEKIKIWESEMKDVFISNINELGTDHLTSRGGGGRGYGFFSKNIFSFPMLLKKIF